MNSGAAFFNFSFHNMGGFLVAFIPALINIAVLFYVILRLPQNRITGIFILFVLSLTLWQFNDALGRISITAETTDLWDSLFSIAWISVGPLCLLFVLSYIGMKKIAKSRLLNSVLIIPSIIFIALYQVHYYPHDFNYSPIWGWLNYHNTDTIDIIQIYWISVQVMIATILLIRHAIMSRKKNHIIRAQTAIIAIGIAIPATAGIVTQMIFPLLLKIDAIPVASAFMSFFSLAAVIGFSRYNLFSVSELINTEQLMENMPVMVFSISPQYVITYMNPTGMRNLGIASTNPEEHKLDDLFRHNSSSEKNKFTEALNASIQGKAILNLEFTIYNKNGQEMDILSSFIPIFNNNIIQGVMIVARDISELNIAFRLTRHQEHLLKEAQQIAHIGSWEWDIRNNIITWSDELFRLYGHEPGAFDVNYEKFLESVHPNDSARMKDWIKSCTIAEGLEEVEYRIILKDDCIRYLSGRGEMKFDDQNQPLFIRGTVQDITERKKAELKIEQNLIELKKSNSELDKFVYSVSHDLRAPLSSMLGVIEIAQDDTIDEVILDYFKMLKGNIKKLDGFVADILDYSRNSRTEIKKEVINFNELISDITQNLKFMGTNNRNVDIKVVVNNKIQVCSDKNRLTFILNNLVSNAIRYQNSQIPNPFVDIEIDTSDTETGIIIRDNGIGIRKELHQKIFDMFYRISEESVGSGLGLYIVKEAVNKLSGNIEVQSEVGQGSTFIIKIPNN